MRLWVYDNAPTALGDCANRLSFMVPLQAPASTPGKVIECRYSITDRVRLRYILDAQGVAHLEHAELLLSGTKDLPQPYPGGPGLPTCNEILPYLLKPPAPPSDAAWTLVCNHGLPVRNEQRPQTELWGLIPVGSDRVDPLPPNRRCWELLVYLGGTTEAQTQPVRCTLD